MSKKITVTSKAKLKAPPTAVCSAFGRVYIATKSRRVFHSADFVTFKSIRFSFGVNTLCTNGELLFCGQSDGSVFGLNEKHKSLFKVKIGETPCIQSFFDSEEEELFVGTENKKITVFSKEELQKNAYFVGSTPLADFDISDNRTLASVSQVDQSIQLIDLKSKEKTTIKGSDGFPETIRFLSDGGFLTGSSGGYLSYFSQGSKKRVSFLKTKGPITAIHILDDESVLIGTPGAILLVDFSNFNRFEVVDEIEIDGIPISFFGKETIYCGISRESRLGRWQKYKKGHNQVIALNIK